MTVRTEWEELPDDLRDELEMLGIPGVTAEEQEQGWRAAVAAYPHFALGWLNLASLTLQRDGVAEAEAIYEGAARAWPEELGAIAGLATVRSAQMRHAEAEQLAQVALSGGYEWPQCWEVVGEARWSRCDSAGAAAAFLAAYEMSPHGWGSLERYCGILGRGYSPPTGRVPDTITLTQLDQLMDFIDDAARNPREHGGTPGCDHTLRFTRRWAERNGIDFIDLYQWANARGGFCDCEVCLNVPADLEEP